MARKKKSPLYASILDDNIIVEPGPKDTKNTTIGEDGTITYKDTKNTDGGSGSSYAANYNFIRRKNSGF